MQKVKTYGKIFLAVTASVLLMPIVFGLADKVTGGFVSNTVNSVLTGVSNAIGLPSSQVSPTQAVITTAEGGVYPIEALRS